jgi:hypothetical protein
MQSFLNELARLTFGAYLRRREPGCYGSETIARGMSPGSLMDRRTRTSSLKGFVVENRLNSTHCRASREVASLRRERVLVRGLGLR